jgi:hypothetical protein
LVVARFSFSSCPNLSLVNTRFFAAQSSLVHAASFIQHILVYCFKEEALEVSLSKGIKFSSFKCIVPVYVAFISRNSILDLVILDFHLEKFQRSDQRLSSNKLAQSLLLPYSHESTMVESALVLSGISKRAKLPAWLNLSEFPQIPLGESSLNLQQVSDVLIALKSSTFAIPHSSLAVLKTRAQPASLDRFAWKIFELEKCSLKSAMERAT